MSSARKRAAIQKANNEADRLRQRLMLAENHINILRTFAEAIGRGGDVMRDALRMIEAQAVAIGTNECSRLAKDALAKVGAGDTAVQGDGRLHGRRPSEPQG